MLILVLKSGKSLDFVPLRALLAVAAHSVMEEADKYGGNASCDIDPFQYNLGEDIELTIWQSFAPLTWNLLGTIIRGLQLYLLGGKQYKAYHFDVHNSEALEVYTRIGFGYIGRPSEPSVNLPLEIASPETHNPFSRRDLALLPALTSSKNEIFRVPYSQMILVLQPKSGTSAESVRAILLMADAWVRRKISIFGKFGPADAIFQYGTGSRPYTRLIVWSSNRVTISWGALETMIDGLWDFLVEKEKGSYTFWEIYSGEVGPNFQLGWGTIIETEGLINGPLSEFAPSNTTFKRRFQNASIVGLPTLNISHSVSV